ncbi:MAG: radical SAM/SPASM domain-containing protein [bacterium]
MKSKDSLYHNLHQRYISIEVTGKCNNACRHCYNFWGNNNQARSSKRNNILSREDISFLIKKVKEDIPLQYVAISGGEPLLRRDLPEILGDIIDMGLQPVVITNGALLSEVLLKRLPRDLYFEITLFANNAALHNRLAGNEVFNQIVWNMARVNRYGSHLTLAFVATKLNALEVQRTVELGIALGAIAVMYNRINLSNRMKQYVPELVPSANMLKNSLTLLQETVRKYQVQSVCSVPIPPCIVDVLQFPNIDFGWCPRGGKNAYYTIGYDGLLRPCNHASFILGDLRQHGFAELITNQKCKTFWKTIPELCKTCKHPLKNQCKGGCTAAAYEFYGTQDRIDPICELALDDT